MEYKSIQFRSNLTGCTRKIVQLLPPYLENDYSYIVDGETSLIGVITGTKGLMYKELASNLGLYTLEYRRMIGTRIEH